MNLELLSNTILFAAIGVIVFARGYISAAYAGLAMNWGFWMPDLMYWLVLSAAGLENNMVSMERMKSLITVPPEAPRKRHQDAQLAKWPSEGHITFDSLQMKYRDDTELVLKGLSFEIFPRERVGIAGRTGSGKSSIGVCLFRIVEAFSGSIIIDGVDISTIGLDVLRQRISLLPQDPALFQGSLRENVDPFDAYTDDELSSTFTSIGFNQSLDKEIGENGENLSAGEKQQVCIARAILRKSRIILLDEATASVDLSLDKKIQTVIREMFVNCTVLTIAHRLNTIMDYDRILVLYDGKVVEFDTPENLMQQKGEFYQLFTKFTASHK